MALLREVVSGNASDDTCQPGIVWASDWCSREAEAMARDWADAANALGVADVSRGSVMLALQDLGLCRWEAEEAREHALRLVRRAEESFGRAQLLAENAERLRRRELGAGEVEAGKNAPSTLAAAPPAATVAAAAAGGVTAVDAAALPTSSCHAVGSQRSGAVPALVEGGRGPQSARAEGTQASTAALEAVLASTGYDESIDHDSLVREAQELESVEVRIVETRERLRMYGEVPPDMQLAQQRLQQMRAEVEALRAELLRVGGSGGGGRGNASPYYDGDSPLDSPHPRNAWM